VLLFSRLNISKKISKIPNEQSEAVRQRRKDNTMANEKIQKYKQ